MAIDTLRECWCASYNCLIVVFICTQRNKDQFKSFLLDKNQGHFSQLWEHLVNPEQTEFGFETITNFKIMKPPERVCKAVKSGIKDRYMSSSLFIIEEELIPKSQIEDAVLLDDIEVLEPSESSLRDQAQELELDIINQHPCMNNLLMLVDFLHRNFEEVGTPSWMACIFDQLTDPASPLAVQILLIKLILNRPSIFKQEIWLPILIKYLGLQNNGAKLFHYFYRDVGKQAICYMGMGYKIEGRPVCQAVNKMVTILPHPDNAYLFSDNISILQRLLMLNKVYVDERTLLRMLKFEETKDNYLEWRMTGVIVFKLCLMQRVPILASYEELLSLESNPERFRFLFKTIESGVGQLTKLLEESKQKYGIAAAGLLGQILRFTDDLPTTRKYFQIVKELTSM